MKILNLIFLLFLTSLVSCKETKSGDSKKQKEIYKGTKNYTLQLPYELKLPSELDEISGIAYYAPDSSVFAIMDEYGILYKINIRNNRTYMAKWEFGPMGDYEELVLVDSTFYVLESSGQIVEIRFGNNDSIFADHYPFPLEGNEFEAMYYDSGLGALRIVCKDCEADDKKTLSTYLFDLATHQFSSQSFKIDVGNIAEEVNRTKMKFKPSGAAFNYKSNELYLISSINKVLVICTPDGVVKDAVAIDKILFKQPEGMAFTDRNTLIISNEAAEMGSSNLLFFKDQLANKQQQLNIDTVHEP